jgi:hypothetical protein
MTHAAIRIVEYRLRFLWIVCRVHLVVAQYVLKIKGLDAKVFLPFAKMV